MNDLPVAVLDQIVRQQAEIDRLKAELERVREKVLWPPNPQSWTVIRITELEKLERQLAEAKHSYEVLKITYTNLEKTHYETTYDRVQRLESQLVEARAENERLTLENRQMLQGMKWDNQLKAIARQEAARECAAMADKYKIIENNDAEVLYGKAIGDDIRETFGLEG